MTIDTAVRQQQTAERTTKIRELAAQELPTSRIAEILGVGDSTVRREAQRAGITLRIDPRHASKAERLADLRAHHHKFRSIAAAARHYDPDVGGARSGSSSAAARHYGISSSVIRRDYEQLGLPTPRARRKDAA